MRYFIELSYDGTAYHGWQIQPNGASVQATLQQALALLLRHDVAVTGAGRTDTGVHARTMVAHFDIDEPLPAPAAKPGGEPQSAADFLVYRLNGVLPPDIAVHRIYPVPQHMHARFSARARTYFYYLHTRKSPFLNQYSWRVAHQPDFEAMNRAAQTLFDYADFTSFSKVNTDTKTNLCRIMRAEWVQLGPHEWRFEIQADRFLRNMVRAIVGTLMLVGRGQLSVEGFRRVIEQKDRCSAGDSVPARGLFLQEVEYPPFEAPSQPASEGLCSAGMPEGCIDAAPLQPASEDLYSAEAQAGSSNSSPSRPSAED